MSQHEVQRLTPQQMADLRIELRDRDEEFASRGPFAAPILRLPKCPACEGTAEQIEMRLEDPELGKNERMLRLRWLPCGHRFRAVDDIRAMNETVEEKIA